MPFCRAQAVLPLPSCPLSFPQPGREVRRKGVLSVSLGTWGWRTRVEFWLLASGQWSSSSFGLLWPPLAWGCTFPRLTPFSVRKKKNELGFHWLGL